MRNTKNAKIEAIKLQSKNEKRATQIGCAHQLKEAVFGFNGLNAGNARGFLWNLLVATDVEARVKFFTELGVTEAEKLQPNDENIGWLVKELRLQFEVGHPGFLNIECESEAEEKAFKALKATNPVIAFIVYAACEKVLDRVDGGKAKYLLASEKENNFFGGIRMLGFNGEEACFLKPYHQQISALFAVMWDEFCDEQNDFVATKNVNSVTESMVVEEKTDNNVELAVNVIIATENEAPMKDAEVLEDPDGLMADEAEIAEKEANNSHLRITVDTIFAFKSLFAKAVCDGDVSAFPELMERGFDLNEVIIKKEKIKNFLQAVNDFVRGSDINIIQIIKEKEGILKFLQALNDFDE